MNRKWCLLKSSDGARGAQGKKKVYEITVDGATVVFEWGMAEKPQGRRRQAVACRTEQGAIALALDKVYAKVDRGYKIAYAV